MPGTTTRAVLPLSCTSGLWMIVATILAGCGTTHEASSTHPPAHPSSSAVYSAPAGWLDFSSDSSRKSLLWFVRKDFRAEIILEEIFDEAPDESKEGEPSRIASLAHAIYSMDKGKTSKVVQEPEVTRGDRHTRWRYLLQNNDGDRLRVVIGVTERYGLVRSAATVRTDGDLQEAARVQDALFAGPPQ